MGGALTYQRAPLHLLPGEATVLMQAQSLTRDGDLRYERLDFDRVLLQIVEPPDLELTSGTGGREVTFDRPFPYSMWLAPFVLWRPETGFAVANVLLLAAAALWASWTLACKSGPLGPFWVTALIFATPMFTSVFRADGDAFVVAAVFAAVGFALRAGQDDGDPRPGRVGRSAMAAGVCLSLAGLWNVLWLVLPLAFLCLWRRAAPRISLLLGVALGAIPQMLTQWWVGGGLHLFGATRYRFTTATGFPAVDFPAQDWSDTVQRLSALHFEGAPVLSWGFDSALWLWNGLFLLIGRHIGLLPYAAVVLVVWVALPTPARLGATGSRRGLWAWLAALCLAVLLLLIFRPFQLFEAGALGPTTLLPLLALAPLVRIAAEPGSMAPLRTTVALFACVALSAPAVLPLWQAPRSVGEARLEPSPLVAPYLPYETSQQRLPGGPWDDIAGLRVRFLGGNGWAESQRERLVMEADKTARMLIASSVPLEGLVLDFDDEASTRLEVTGGHLDELLLRPSGGVGFQILLDPGRRHVMWWSPSPRWLYFLDLSFLPSDDGSRVDPKPLPFRVGLLVAGETEGANDAASGESDGGVT